MRVLQKRAHGRGHQLGPLGMKPSRFPLDKAHHVGRPQTIEPDVAIAKALGEKGVWGAAERKKQLSF